MAYLENIPIPIPGPKNLESIPIPLPQPKCLENIPLPKSDSEMEEGEIVDDLSDISSEEEFLLRQRLQVLENYNNVLERKKAKRASSIGPGNRHRKEDTLLYDLSEISATDFDDCYTPPPRPVRVQKRQKTHHKPKRKREDATVNILKTKEHKKKNHHSKKKLEVKVISESSEESEDEYRNRRRKLADAVVVHKDKNDKTSLSERLQKMLCGVNPEPINIIDTASNDETKTDSEKVPLSLRNIDDNTILSSEPIGAISENQNSFELIDLCTDEDSKTLSQDLQQDTVDSVTKVIENNLKKNSDKDSDEDLELLRQHALKTKTVKAKVPHGSVQAENKILSEDEDCDSDTAELRLICLKSALLKKAIEMKQKQKLRKKLSQSSNLHDDFLHSDNNTDIESVDMDIGSDADEKIKENSDPCVKIDTIDKHNGSEITTDIVKDNPKVNIPGEDELEDDEDLLRAKLLTSLSKNLPNLVNPNLIDTIENNNDTKTNKARPISPRPPQVKSITPAVVPEEKRFIINLGESDSEGEHEATRNLTKMHMKLSEQKDFQQRLDMFLKSTRLEVEKTKLPDVVQQQAPPKKNEKFVAKAVKHLPKSEQIEYKNLVKRMAELEKIKQARQATMNLLNELPAPIKDTLKPRNATVDSTKISVLNNLEEKIQISRKHIAEESAKMMKLKDEAIKLSQKYKIVATELRNIKTAIALNKKHTRSVQNCLTKIRLHHQMLLKSSITSSHSTINGNIPYNQIALKLQKENNPAKEEQRKPTVIKPVAVNESHIVRDEQKTIVNKPTKIVKDSNITKIEHTIFVINNPVKEPPSIVNHPRLSVQLDVAHNKKVVKITTSTSNNSKLNEKNKDENEGLLENKTLSRHPLVEKGGGTKERGIQNDDYKSPLDAFGSTTWEGDPNAILCPFEVGGDCKDADCKYLHTKSLSISK